MTTKRTVKEMIAATSPEMESLRSDNRDLASLLWQAKLAQGQVSEVLSAIASAVKKEHPVRIPNVTTKSTRTGGKPITQVVQLTDWHVGLVTPKEAIEEFGENNWAVTQRRVADLVSSLTKYTATMRSGYTLDDLVILGTGDYCSGDIHEGLIRTNEFPTPVQAVKAGLLMASTIRALAAVYPNVRVEFMTPGNHDRLTKKPQAQAGGWNSWGFVVGSIAKESLANQQNVTFNLHPTMQEIVNVQGRRYLTGHGDGIIGTWGIPFYGIERKLSREATARMNMPKERRFDKIVIGHFHTGLDHEHWMIGGSLSGTDENDHKCGRHSRAHQTSWLVHPEHGEFGFTRWYLG
jgi:hypothetical protein